MTIRPYDESDLSALHRINVACVPAVGQATEKEMAEIIALSTCLVATSQDDMPIGFITLLPPGTAAYASPNLRCFEDYVAHTRKTLIYVDRIALSPDARSQRIGEALYESAFQHFASCDEIGCEVNVEPPNPGSHRFHKRLGFLEIGEQVFEPSLKSVRYYSRPLSPPIATS
ncbi:MAG: GNAT family N-acetyltransferase [Henriciella sp.]|nr:GNAT family N-acetyltransferase [Henriciella sp.]